MDDPEEYIDFMAKYREWISIKRLGIRDTTKPEEVVHHLAGIRSTIDNKSYPILGVKTDSLDKYASQVTTGSRKNYESLAEALKKLGSPESKRVIAESCSKELSPVAEIYLLGKVIKNVGYDTSINQNVTKKIYPYLKIPKPLGRGKEKKIEEE